MPKKIKKIISIIGVGGGVNPMMENSIMFLLFFLNPSLNNSIGFAVRPHFDSLNSSVLRNIWAESQYQCL